ncbi:histone deacetylase [Rheinheimera riviphila]|uniref:Histone deacetylase n=1 Tax=Rheinheimera riviphila TaxID=1834037 RepID=A0A437R1A3_9GAMM|nr:histone deacetylase [Rheinheimera riviphila]RVU40503.1 histone deacetylase [Rheinheimera riviphila]
MHWPPLIYDACYSALQLPDRHRYPIGKYRALYQALLAAGVPLDCFVEPTSATRTELALVHDPLYIEALCSGQLDTKAMRRIGFPWSEFLINRSLRSVGGTIQTAQLALQHGLALHLSGGYHHAFASEGSGFCLFNDLAVAARVLQQQGVDKILIFDCDVHQGDGSALIFADDPQIITASLHGEKNFPARKQQSDWDLALPNGCTDAPYLEAVQQSLDYLLALHQPDLVLYDAGVDIHQQDDLGLLSVSTQGILARDQLVIHRCRDLKIPLAAVIGGGYQRDLTALTAVHLQLFKAAFVSLQLPVDIPT